MGDKREDGSNIVYVHPLTSNLSTEHLREIFGHFGKVKSVELRPLQMEESNRKYGVVDFENYDDAKYSILHMNEGEIDGVRVRVGFSVPRNHNARSGSK